MFLASVRNWICIKNTFLCIIFKYVYIFAKLKCVGVVYAILGSF